MVSKFLVLFPLALALCTSAVAADMKIATVDMQKALQSVDAGKQAKAELEKEFDAKKKQLEKENNAIRKAQEEFKKQAAVLSDAARTKKASELQERYMKLQESTARSQAEIQQKEQTLTEPIIDKLRGIVGDLAKQKGYNLVLEKNDNMVLYSLPQDDLTEDVISAYNKGAK